MPILFTFYCQARIAIDYDYSCATRPRTASNRSPNSYSAALAPFIRMSTRSSSLIRSSHGTKISIQINCLIQNLIHLLPISANSIASLLSYCLWAPPNPIQLYSSIFARPNLHCSLICYRDNPTPINSCQCPCPLQRMSRTACDWRSWGRLLAWCVPYMWTSRRWRSSLSISTWFVCHRKSASRQLHNPNQTGASVPSTITNTETCPWYPWTYRITRWNCDK